MIGMASENAGRTPQLFGEHRAGHEMRPGHRPEGKQQIGPLAGRIAVAISCADQKARLAHALVAPAAKQGCEFLGGKLSPALVEQHIA